MIVVLRGSAAERDEQIRRLSALLTVVPVPGKTDRVEVMLG